MSVRSNLDKQFAALSSFDVNDIQPLNLTVELLIQLVETLIAQGCTFSNISEEGIKAVNETQFRSLDSGRGPFVVAVLGRKKAEDLLVECLRLGKKYKHKRIVSSKTGQPIEGTQGRPLMQAAFDILKIAYYANGMVDWEGVRQGQETLNRRSWRGNWLAHKDSDERKMIDKIFVDCGDRPTAKTASTSPGSIFDLWMYMTGRLE
jgi:hypothetical protein